MGETTTLERDNEDVFAPATFEESVVDTSPEIEATKANIEHTRAEMSETINAIKEQLSPKRLVEEAKEAASEAVSDKVTEVKDAVMDKVSDIAHGAGEIAHNVVATVTGAAHSLGDKVSELTDSAKDKISDLTHGHGTHQSGTTSAPRYPNQTGLVTTTGFSGSKQTFTGDLVMDTIKENPIPAALVGVGLGWLLVDAAIKAQKRNEHPLVGTTGYNGYGTQTYGETSYGEARGASYGAYTANGGTNYSTGNSGTGGIKSALDQAGNKLSATGEKIGDAVDGAKAKIGDTAQDLQAKIGGAAQDLQAKASDLAHTVQDKASDLAHTVQDKASDATTLVTTKASEFGQAAQSNARKAAYATQDFVTDNPIAAGAIALLVGAVIGLALPATEPENKLMGTYRDQLADQAGQQAQDLLGKVQSVAGDAINVAKEQLVEGKESVKVQMNDAMDKVQSQLAEAKDKVQSAVETSAKASNLIPT